MTADWVRLEHIEEEVARMADADPSMSALVRDRLCELVASGVIRTRDR